MLSSYLIYFVVIIELIMMKRSIPHFRNPNVPTVHFNYRYFEVQESSGKIRWALRENLKRTQASDIRRRVFFTQSKPVLGR